MGGLLGCVKKQSANDNCLYSPVSTTSYLTDSNYDVPKRTQCTAHGKEVGDSNLEPQSDTQEEWNDGLDPYSFKNSVPQITENTTNTREEKGMDLSNCNKLVPGMRGGMIENPQVQCEVEPYDCKKSVPQVSESTINNKDCKEVDSHNGKQSISQIPKSDSNDKKSVPQITKQTIIDYSPHIIWASYIISVKLNRTLIKDLSNSIDVTDWYSKTDNNTYCTEPIENGTLEYQEVATQFKSTNKKCFKIDYIEKVYNVYLYLQFRLKEKAKASRLQYPITANLFHGTRACNIIGICQNNFDWRLRGTALGHKFGQGVSFTNISNYATHYGDLKRPKKVMILAQVLVSGTCIGNSKMVIPLECYDTATNHNNQVFVKFEDNEFYPSYVIHYRGFDPTRNR
ncbi:unnamed protein product [Acanthoscelides obtectus]|uniref:Poly [ADP-ribose] polymerase n=1 Tax=Acanthoscelides obtectus TaxID=200917 RepID=A0A9P0KI68_ACAOB|nr:unnamed protein product [Acanthoscelides obtectus]CAK1667713.1 Poly [ADP-ribose] polymerase 12 [Acanthoscelides obtectus]